MSVNAKQKSKALFTGLQKQKAKTSYVIKPMTVNTRPTYNFPGITFNQQQPFQGSPLYAVKGKGGSYSQRHFNVEVRTNPLVLTKPKLLRVQDFPNVHPLIKKLFLKKEISNVPQARILTFFVKNWQKVTTDPVFMSYVAGYKIPLLEIQSQNSSPHPVSINEEEKMIGEMLKKTAIATVQNKPEQFVSSIFIFPNKSSGFRPGYQLLWEVQPFQNGRFISSE